MFQWWHFFLIFETKHLFTPFPGNTECDLDIAKGTVLQKVVFFQKIANRGMEPLFFDGYLFIDCYLSLTICVMGYMISSTVQPEADSPCHKNQLNGDGSFKVWITEDKKEGQGERQGKGDTAQCLKNYLSATVSD